MHIDSAVQSDLSLAIQPLVRAFSEDGITGFLLQKGAGYEERLQNFFSLLMRARLALKMPVLVARDGSDILGAVMGYKTSYPAWPADIDADWVHFESTVPGIAQRMDVYDGIAYQYKPSVPHYYLGVIGVDPASQGSGVGKQLLKSFCELSAADPLSEGVYLETAQPSNIAFYERAGFLETGRGKLGDDILWCMYLSHTRDGASV